MHLKRRRNVGLIGIVGLAAVLLTTAWTVMADYDYEQIIIWTPPEQEDSIAGAWLCSWPGLAELGITEPLKMQQTLMPLGLSDSRLLIRETDFNAADPPGVEGAFWSDLVGIAVKTGRNTYEYRANGYVKLPQLNDRGKIIYYTVITGKTELIDRDNRYESDFNFMIYGPDADVQPADGFPDEVAQPVQVFGPLEGQWFRRVRLMPGPELSPPPEGQ